MTKINREEWLDSGRPNENAATLLGHFILHYLGTLGFGEAGDKVAAAVRDGGVKGEDGTTTDEVKLVVNGVEIDVMPTFDWLHRQLKREGEYYDNDVKKAASKLLSEKFGASYDTLSKIISDFEWKVRVNLNCFEEH